MLPGVKVMIPLPVSNMATGQPTGGATNKKLPDSNNIKRWSNFVPLPTLAQSRNTVSDSSYAGNTFKAKTAPVGTKYKTVTVNSNGVIQKLSVPQCPPMPQILNCTDINTTSEKRPVLPNKFITQPVVLLTANNNNSGICSVSAASISSGKSLNNSLQPDIPKEKQQTTVLNLPVYKSFKPGTAIKNTTDLVNDGPSNLNNGSLFVSCCQSNNCTVVSNPSLSISTTPSMVVSPTSLLGVLLASGTESVSTGIPVTYSVALSATPTTLSYSDCTNTTVTRSSQISRANECEFTTYLNLQHASHLTNPSAGTLNVVNSKSTVSKSNRSKVIDLPARYVTQTAIPTTIPIVPSLLNADVPELKISSVFSLSKGLPTPPTNKEVSTKNCYHEVLVRAYDQAEESRKICCGTLYRSRNRALYLIHQDHTYSKLFYKLVHDTSISSTQSSKEIHMPLIPQTQTARKRTSKLKKMAIKGDKKAQKKIKRQNLRKGPKNKTLSVSLRRINTGGVMSLSLGVLRMLNPGMRFKRQKYRQRKKFVPLPLQVHSYSKPSVCDAPKKPRKKTYKKSPGVKDLPKQPEVTEAQNNTGTPELCEDAFWVTPDNKIIKYTEPDFLNEPVLLNELVLVNEPVLLNDDSGSSTISAVSPSYDCNFDLDQELDEESKTYNEVSNRESSIVISSSPGCNNSNVIDLTETENSTEPMQIFDVEQVVEIGQNIKEGESDIIGADTSDASGIFPMSRQTRIKSLKDLLAEQTQKLDTIRKTREEDSNSIVMEVDA